MPDPARLTIDLVYGPLTITFLSPTRKDRDDARKIQDSRSDLAAELANLAAAAAKNKHYEVAIPPEIRGQNLELLKEVEVLLLKLMLHVSVNGDRTDGEEAKNWVKEQGLFYEWSNALEAFNQVYFRKWVEVKS